jgi:hypothetical protein
MTLDPNNPLHAAAIKATEATFVARAKANRAVATFIRQIVRDEILKDRVARAQERLDRVTAELEATKSAIAKKK